MAIAVDDKFLMVDGMEEVHALVAAREGSGLACFWQSKHKVVGHSFAFMTSVGISDHQRL